VRQTFISFWDKTLLAATGVGRVVRIWQYALLALVVFAIFGVIMTLSSKGTTEWSLLISSLPLSEKLHILLEACGRLFTNIVSVTGAITFAVSILQGLIIATITYNIRNQEVVSSNRIGESTLASIAMVIGLGCSSCGTSLLVPLLAWFRLRCSRF
jgi:K+-sensing histidine kinase KdpD